MILQLYTGTMISLCVHVYHIDIFCFNPFLSIVRLDETAPWTAAASTVLSVSCGCRGLGAEGQDGGNLYELRERTDMWGIKLLPVIFH